MNVSVLKFAPASVSLTVTAGTAALPTETIVLETSVIALPWSRVAGIAPGAAGGSVDTVTEDDDDARAAAAATDSPGWNVDTATVEQADSSMVTFCCIDACVSLASMHATSIV